VPKGQTRPAIDPVVIAQSVVSSQNASYNLSMTQSFLSLAVFWIRMVKTIMPKNKRVYSYMEKNTNSKTHFDMQIHCLTTLVA